jgi:class 3 adenylate cyclase/predicted ATPase/energy-coupling factor transporter ATP-binding protein EcfA2
MTFDEILTQVLELLQREKRVSYRALKRRFDLDDEYLEDLKDEIIKAKRLAMDEEGFVLVWTGDAQTVTSQADQSPQQPAAQAPHSPLVDPHPTAPPPPDAERRQLTVMFCDLVDSTKLSSQLDPEDLREVIRAYQKVCSEVITRFDGHIAQLLGDGLLVYFGYPHAHEDDAQRAVRAGLGMLAAMGDLNSRLQQAQGIQLAVRLGVHTGLVVVGEMGSSGRQEQLALGETPNLAARLQGLAEPNMVVISNPTLRLIQGYFECQDLGAQTLRGVAEPVHVYRVLQESGATGRLDVAQPRGLTPLVGRESEVTLLLERWTQAKSSQGQVVLLTGDAGIGKSRLVQMLKEHAANEPHTCWECRSSEYYQNTALFPLVDLFQRLLRFEAHETADTKLEKLTHALSQYRLPLEESVQLFAPLFSLPLPEDRYPPLNLSPQRQRQKTLESLVAIMLELAERQPVLFILEDLHWTDPTTLELLHLVIEQIPTTAILTVLTCRPTFQPSWSHRSYLSEITVNRLSHTQVEQIVNRMTDGKTFPQEVLQQIITKTDGVPLFIEEITKAILESGHLKEVDGHYDLIGSFSTFAIPATLQDSLMARLDRLVTAKGVAQMGATIGRQFAYDLLQAVSPLDASMLQRELGRLVKAEIVYQRGVPPQATYVFKHTLIQDAAYTSLLKSTRQQYHQRIAQVLAERFSETAETQPELVARHYTEAGLQAEALPYWHQAGQRAMARSAYAEALHHLTTGLEVLATVPETPTRHQHELDLLTALTVALGDTKGYAAPELERVLARAETLAQQVGEPPQRFAVLYALWSFRNRRAEHQAAQAVAEQLLDLAQRQHDPALLLGAYLALGITLGNLGAFAPARTHLEQGIALYDPQRHAPPHTTPGGRRNLGVSFRALVVEVLEALGYPDQAVQRSQEALTMAHALAHPYSLVMALRFSARLHAHRREWQTAQAHAEALLALATEHGFALYVALGAFFQGWARAAQGQGAEGIALMWQSLDASRATGTALGITEVLAQLAEAYGQVGQVEEGLHLLAEALAIVDTTGERFYEAELHRLRGELLLRHAVPEAQAAEGCFHEALAIARRQQATSWELRAATSLARLWQQQGKRAEAYELLAPVYGWFTEGFDTADLQDAKALLDALA